MKDRKIVKQAIIAGSFILRTKNEWADEEENGQSILWCITLRCAMCRTVPHMFRRQGQLAPRGLIASVDRHNFPRDLNPCRSQQICDWKGQTRCSAGELTWHTTTFFSPQTNENSSPETNISLLADRACQIRKRVGDDIHRAAYHLTERELAT